MAIGNCRSLSNYPSSMPFKLHDFTKYSDSTAVHHHCRTVALNTLGSEYFVKLLCDISKAFHSQSKSLLLHFTPTKLCFTCSFTTVYVSLAPLLCFSHFNSHYCCCPLSFLSFRSSKSVNYHGTSFKAFSF